MKTSDLLRAFAWFLVVAACFAVFLIYKMTSPQMEEDGIRRDAARQVRVEHAKAELRR